MGSFVSVESWASRLGYVVERTESGYVWHSSDDHTQRVCQTEPEVVEAIMASIRSEYEVGK